MNDKIINRYDPEARKEYQQVILKLMIDPFPIKQLSYLLHEMTEKEIRNFQSFLNIQKRNAVRIDGLIQLRPFPGRIPGNGRSLNHVFFVLST